MAFALAAGIGAGGSLLSSLIGSSASSQAAKEQQQASMNSIDFDTNLLGLAQTWLKPYLSAGTNALGPLSNLLTPGANQESTLESLPGFKFQSKWGTKSTQNALASEGLGGSTGPLAQSISNYNNGLASTYYGNYINQLMGLAGIGQSAAGTMAGQGTATAGMVGQQLTNSGNAAAAGTLGSANALSGGLTGAAGSASNALILNSLLGGAGGGGLYGGTGGGLNGLSNSALYGKFAGAGLA